jgi:hypothetical protein
MWSIASDAGRFVSRRLTIRMELTGGRTPYLGRDSQQIGDIVLVA